MSAYSHGKAALDLLDPNTLRAYYLVISRLRCVIVTINFQCLRLETRGVILVSLYVLPVARCERKTDLLALASISRVPTLCMYDWRFL
jgi:hypothetical protein